MFDFDPFNFFEQYDEQHIEKGLLIRLVNFTGLPHIGHNGCLLICK